MPTRDPKILGANVTHFRKAMRWTKEELAEAVGVSLSNITKLENASTGKPSHDLIADLARLFGVTSDQLARENLEGLDERVQAVTRLNNNFTEEEWGVVLGMIDYVTRNQTLQGRFR